MSSDRAQQPGPTPDLEASENETTGSTVISASCLNLDLNLNLPAFAPVHEGTYIELMSRHPDLWYRKLFSDPRVIEDLMRSFVHEPFVEGLDFSTDQDAQDLRMPRIGTSAIRNSKCPIRNS